MPQDASVEFQGSRNGQVWVYDGCVVEWKWGSKTLRRFEFRGETVLEAGFVDFESVKDCLVIVLEDRAQVYYVSKGDSTTVSFPFSVSKAFFHANGVVLERKIVDYQLISQSRPTSSGIKHRFITLSDPLNLFGSLVISSNLQELESRLTILHFPPTWDQHIGVLYDSSTRGLSFYNSKILTALKNSSASSSHKDPAFKNKESQSKAYGALASELGGSYGANEKNANGTAKRTSSVGHGSLASSSSSAPFNNAVNTANSLSTELTNNLRKISIMNRRSVSATVGPDPDQPQQQQQQPNSNSGHTGVDSIKRSASATLDRMVSGSGLDIAPSHASHISQELFDHAVLTKDVILTKISQTTLPIQLTSKTRISSCKFEDKEAITLHDPGSQWGKIWIFDLNSSLTENMRFKALNSSPISLTKIIDIKWSLVSCFSVYESELLSGFLMLLGSARNEVTLYNPFLNLTSSSFHLPSNENHTSLYHSKDNAVLTNIDSVPVQLLIVPEVTSVKHYLRALSYLCDQFTYTYVLLLWQVARKSLSDAQEENADFDALKYTLLSFLHFEDCPEHAKKHLSAIKQCPIYSSSFDGARYLPKIVMGMHLIREEYKLNLLQRDNVQQTGRLLCLLTRLMNWPSFWQEFYGAEESIDDNFVLSNKRFAHPLDEPPSILKSLYSATDGSSLPVTPFITFSRLLEEGYFVDNIVTPRTHKMLQLFESFETMDYSETSLLNVMNSLNIDQNEFETYPLGVFAPLRRVLKSIEKQMSDSDAAFDFTLVDRLDLQKNGRILLFLETKSNQNARCFAPFPEEKHNTNLNWNFGDLRAIKPIKAMVKEIIDLTTDHSDDKVSITKSGEEVGDGQTLKRNASLIFSEDRRFYDVVELLVYNIPHKVMMHVVEKSYTKTLKKKRIYSQIVALRTFVSAIGWGAVAFSTERPLATQKWPRNKLNLHCTFPDKTTVTVDPKTCDPNLISWGQFHGGVSSGLKISPKSTGITGSWITFTKPPELDAQHGGFLLGLGLNGHLKNLEEWHVYNYLSPKQTHTSIGLMLGMSASLKGTMDLKLTKVLSVHIVALLPQGSSDLNVNFRVQTAGLIGVGLLYLSSQHRRMTDMLFSQVTSYVNINEEAVPDEGYRLAAGIALGLINLGAGAKISQFRRDDPMSDFDGKGSEEDEVINDYTEFKANDGMLDPKITAGLLSIISGSHDTEENWMPANSQIGTVVALMLIYLKTNNHTVAGRLAPSFEEINVKSRLYMRPELFMYREWACHMILWDHIGYSSQWLFEELDLSTPLTLNTDSLPQFYCIAGRALAVGLKFASTGNLTVRDNLISVIDKMLPLYQCSVDMRLDFQLSIKAIDILINVLLVASSMVMSGTGDLSVLRRVKYLHENITGKYSDLFRTTTGKPKPKNSRANDAMSVDSSEDIGTNEYTNRGELVDADDSDIEDDLDIGDDRVEEDEEQGNFTASDNMNAGDAGDDTHHWNDDENHFGKYMATSLCLGFLFLGSGQYAFKTSSLESLAYLAISVLPTYMKPYYLQETKHFWSMAVEYRSLLIRNSKTGASLNKVPVEVVLKRSKGESSSTVMKLDTPCLLPDVRKIRSIKVSSPDYYPVSLNLSGEQDCSNFFNNGCVLFVPPKDESDENWEHADDNADRCLEVKHIIKKKALTPSSKHSSNSPHQSVVQLFKRLGITNQEALEFGSEVRKSGKIRDPSVDENLLMSCQNRGKNYHLELWRRRHGF
ncbi:LANO_0H03554g1_1 [Lachancea nothofagi CBS 11611]|uniref:LANO_0H03554g1_1 n=1 Tax=Lachancea nothofagi CBS 11611 TaxID=1266666 RepID=A0A1G4KLA5_9SACH|nr:LANO_0H03554g1_1 [Lachancea nothofagi CBS 11611]